MTNQIPTGSPTAKLSNGKFNSPYQFNSAELLQGFSDADNDDALQVVSVAAENGELSEKNGIFTFTPNNNFNGNVAFDYVISDSNGAELNTTQAFNIMAANQIPTGSPSAKLADSKINSTYLLSSVNLLQGFSDANNDLLRVSAISSENGEITDNANGTFTFTPDNGFSGAVTLDYVVSDDNGGEIGANQTFNLVSDIAVIANQAPTGSASAKLVDGKKNVAYVLSDFNLLQGFSDVNNDVLRISLISAENGEVTDNNNGTFTFTADKDFSGSVSLDYVVTDNQGGDINATQKFNILSENQPVPSTTDPIITPPPLSNSALITLTPKNPNFRGSASDVDNVEGSTIADNIVGAIGNDTLKGNSGDDTIDGGNDNDQLFGNADDDSLIGGDGNDSLNGGDDNDVLDGGNGNDTLDGGSGADKMTGGNGDDVYFVENISDSVVESSSPLGGKDTVNSNISLAQLDAIEIINLLGENDINAIGDNSSNTITGNIGNNKLLGNGGNDSLFGSEGNDTLDGGTGIDYLNGGQGDDTYVIDNSADVIEDAAGKDSVQSSETISLVSYPTVENLELTGSKAIKGTGNDNANIITGNSSNNELKGDKGNDTLLGNDGDDTLNGGTGENVLDGGNDEDTVIYNGASSNYRLSIADSVSVTNILTGEIDQLIDVEFVKFNDETLPILNNEIQALSLSISDIQLKEGNKNGAVEATLVLTLDQEPTEAIEVEISTEDGTAISGKDYTELTQIVTFEPNQKTQKVKIKINSDTVVEDNENFVVKLANQTDGVELKNTEATVTILNDDKSSLSISNVTIVEGAKGKANAEVVVKLSSPASTPVTVHYKTADGTAKSSTDYKVTEDNLTFAIGETSKTILIPIVDDKLPESSEYFRVALSNPKDALLAAGKSSAKITITDNDTKLNTVESTSRYEVLMDNEFAIQLTGSVDLTA